MHIILMVTIIIVAIELVGVLQELLANQNYIAHFTSMLLCCFAVNMVVPFIFCRYSKVSTRLLLVRVNSGIGCQHRVRDPQLV